MRPIDHFPSDSCQLRVPLLLSSVWLLVLMIDHLEGKSWDSRYENHVCCEKVHSVISYPPSYPCLNEYIA